MQQCVDSFHLAKLYFQQGFVSLEIVFCWYWRFLKRWEILAFFCEVEGRLGWSLFIGKHLICLRMPRWHLRFKICHSNVLQQERRTNQTHSRISARHKNLQQFVFLKILSSAFSYEHKKSKFYISFYTICYAKSCNLLASSSWDSWFSSIHNIRGLDLVRRT